MGEMADYTNDPGGHGPEPDDDKPKEGAVLTPKGPPRCQLCNTGHDVGNPCPSPGSPDVIGIIP